MENNVIQGRIIKSSMKDWDLEFYIDSEDYHDANTLFADVYATMAVQAFEKPVNCILQVFGLEVAGQAEGDK